MMGVKNGNWCNRIVSVTVCFVHLECTLVRIMRQESYIYTCKCNRTKRSTKYRIFVSFFFPKTLLLFI